MLFTGNLELCVVATMSSVEVKAYGIFIHEPTQDELWKIILKWLEFFLSSDAAATTTIAIISEVFNTIEIRNIPLIHQEHDTHEKAEDLVSVGTLIDDGSQTRLGREEPLGRIPSVSESSSTSSRLPESGSLSIEAHYLATLLNSTFDETEKSFEKAPPTKRRKRVDSALQQHYLNVALTVGRLMTFCDPFPESTSIGGLFRQLFYQCFSDNALLSNKAIEAFWGAYCGWMKLSVFSTTKTTELCEALKQTILASDTKGTRKPHASKFPLVVYIDSQMALRGEKGEHVELQGLNYAPLGLRLIAPGQLSNQEMLSIESVCDDWFCSVFTSDALFDLTNMELTLIGYLNRYKLFYALITGEDITAWGETYEEAGNNRPKLTKIDGHWSGLTSAMATSSTTQPLRLYYAIINTYDTSKI